MKLAEFEELDYDEQAETFLRLTKSTIRKELIGHDFYFIGDTQKRDIYKVTITRDDHYISFTFGQSIAEFRKTPSDYSILACIEKYEYEDFQDFCDNLGYDEDSRKAHKIFKKCQKLAKKVNALYSGMVNLEDSEMDFLYAIQ